MTKERPTDKPKTQPARRKPASLPYRSRKTLLTPGERRFYDQGLKPAIADRYLISFKVRLADVITVENWECRYGRKIAQKHIDFVLVTPRLTRIVAVIELNDATHDAPDRQRRDAFLSEALHSAGIPLVTFPIYYKYESEKIRRRITAALEKKSNKRHRKHS